MSVEIETDATGEDLTTLAATSMTMHVLSRLKEDEYLTSDDVVVERQGVITRFYKSAGGLPATSQLTLADLMDENADYEDSAWVYLREMVEEGMYDDSDPRSTMCVYMANDADALFAAVKEWYEANPEVVASADLESPDNWTRR
jgi:hypothetical protein